MEIFLQMYDNYYLHFQGTVCFYGRDDKLVQILRNSYSEPEKGSFRNVQGVSIIFAGSWDASLFVRLKFGGYKL